MDGKTIALCIGATAAVGTLIFTVGRYFWDKAESRAEERGRTSESVNDLKTTLGRIEGHLLSLVRHFLPARAVAQDNSPAQLNELGKTVSNQLEAAAWARQVAGKLQSEFQGMEPFELDESAKEYVQNDRNFPEEFQRAMRRAAYELNIEMPQVRAVLAIELRDALINRMPDKE